MKIFWDRIILPFATKVFIRKNRNSNKYLVNLKVEPFFLALKENHAGAKLPVTKIS